MEIQVTTTQPQVVVGDGGTAVVTVGLQGPAGANGTGQVFQFQQSTPAAAWIVNHNFGYRPNVSVLSPGGVEMLAQIVHASVNQVLIYFDQPTSGLAVCS